MYYESPVTHALPVFLPSLPILTVHKKYTELVLQMFISSHLLVCALYLLPKITQTYNILV